MMFHELGLLPASLVITQAENNVLSLLKMLLLVITYVSEKWTSSP